MRRLRRLSGGISHSFPTRISQITRIKLNKAILLIRLICEIRVGKHLIHDNLL